MFIAWPFGNVIVYFYNVCCFCIHFRLNDIIYAACLHLPLFLLSFLSFFPSLLPWLYIFRMFYHHQIKLICKCHFILTKREKNKQTNICFRYFSCGKIKFRDVYRCLNLSSNLLFCLSDTWQALRHKIILLCMKHSCHYCKIQTSYIYLWIS